MYQLRGMHHCPGRDLEDIQEVVRMMNEAENSITPAKPRNTGKPGKVIFPLLLSLVLVFISSIPVLAAPVINDYELPTYYTENDRFITWEYTEAGNYRFWCLIIPEKAQVYAYVENGNMHVTSDVAMCYGYIADSGYYQTGEWKLTPLNVTSFSCTYDELVSSDYDIYDIEGNLVFQAPSPLVRVATEIQPKMVTKEIIGMIPLLIPLLAGYLGLRKAWSLISRTLRVA